MLAGGHGNENPNENWMSAKGNALNNSIECMIKYVYFQAFLFSIFYSLPVFI